MTSRVPQRLHASEDLTASSNSCHPGPSITTSIGQARHLYAHVLKSARRTRRRCRLILFIVAMRPNDQQKRGPTLRSALDVVRRLATKPQPLAQLAIRGRALAAANPP